MNIRSAIRAAFSLAAFSLLTLAMIGAIYFFFFGRGKTDTLRVSAQPLKTVIIDAGHGGMDGGCVSDVTEKADTVSGVSAEGRILEKDCNLQISKVLAALFRVSGYNVVMTRTEDVMLDGEGLAGSAKMRDLRARLNIAEEYPDALFISVHCNKFPSASCKGLQVYYSKNHEYSKEAAYAVQNSAVALLQSENKRLPKQADSSIFVLDRAKQPAILIECGFLSNPDEAKLLSSEEYQKKLALTVLLPLIAEEQNG